MTLFLIGECTSTKVEDTCRRLGWGRMWVHRRIRPLPGELWGFDNGVFGDHMNGRQWDSTKWLARLELALAVGTPYLAVAPDILGGGVESLMHSVNWLPRLPRLLPWYLAVQDGMTPGTVRPYLDGFAGIFLGGTNRFKTTAPEWCAFAHRHGLRFHFARCSSPSRLHWCREMGADSADSTQPLWTEKMFSAFVRAYENPQQTAPLFGGELI